jgi:hypothetical protein
LRACNGQQTIRFFVVLFLWSLIWKSMEKQKICFPQ